MCEETDDGNYIYYSGEFQNPIDAQNHLNNIKKLGYKNSCIIKKSKMQINKEYKRVTTHSLLEMKISGERYLC